MRILHTSDWHLGKRLFKLDRAPEHALFLDWLIFTLKERRIDLLLIAGDIFDTPMPPHQALQMFYDFLHRVSEETEAETLIIAGNHDSGLLLEAPLGILKHHRVKVWGKLSMDVDHHWYRYKDLDICAIPFFRSHELLAQGEDHTLIALEKYLKREKQRPQLLMLHHLAGMYEAAGSEQVIGLSGVDSIPAEILSRFDYVALGHIHKPQKISERARYSGSPLPLRFSETLGKSVVILDDELRPHTLPVPLSRALVTLKVSETDWRKKVEELRVESDLTPVVEVQIRLSSPKAGLIDEIREALTSKGVELLSFIPQFEIQGGEAQRAHELFHLSTEELFEKFYAQKYPQDPTVPNDVKDDFREILQEVKNANSAPKD